MLRLSLLTVVHSSLLMVVHRYMDAVNCFDPYDLA